MNCCTTLNYAHLGAIPNLGAKTETKIDAAASILNAALLEALTREKLEAIASSLD